VVVVGAGLAGSRTVVELRAQGFTGQITLLGAEGLPPYDRPPLSKHLIDRPSPAWLADELGTDALALADDVRLDDPATGLAVGAHGVVVRTARGEVAADAVVLATGAQAVRPAGWSGARTLHTAADAQALRDALGAAVGADDTGPRRLVVVGAGWIGAEVATVAAAAGVEVTVVEATSAPLSGALGVRVGGLTAPWYAAAGIRLLTGVRVTEVGPDGVRLTTVADGSASGTGGSPSGTGGSADEPGSSSPDPGDDATGTTVLPADVVLVAVGARPATGWIGDALPREADGSVRVDEGYAPIGGSPRVRAVGDVARRRSARHGWVPGGHWDAALRGPAVLVEALLADLPGLLDGSSGSEASEGTSASGSPVAAERTDLAPYVFSTQLGHELALYGLPGADDEVLLRGDPAGAQGWTALWFAPGTDRLTAVLAVNRPKDVAGARRLFALPTLPDLDRERATDPAVPLPRTTRA
jgi:NADPH-dependent 2,4-dienoyl-CoA reductase/sulfur reductase-like enzyme